MKYYFYNEESTEAKEIVKVNDNEWMIDGKSYWVKQNSGSFFYSQSGKNWTKLVLPKENSLAVTSTKTFQVYRGFWPSGFGNESAGSLITNMPGKIIKVNVAKGQNVKKGETLLILEAMKMENEIKASIDGVVTEILVQAGQNIDTGTKMLEIQ